MNRKKLLKKAMRRYGSIRFQNQAQEKVVLKYIQALDDLRVYKTDLPIVIGLVIAFFAGLAVSIVLRIYQLDSIALRFILVMIAYLPAFELTKWLTVNILFRDKIEEINIVIDNCCKDSEFKNFIVNRIMKPTVKKSG